MLKGYQTLLLIALVCLAPPTSALAISAEVAKKCDILVAKQFPPRQLGNPAAGSAKGSAKDQREYFQKCVNNDGKMDDSGSSKTK